MSNVVICKDRSCFYEGGKAHPDCRCLDESEIERLTKERDALKAESERLRRKLLGASEHLRIHGYGFGEHDSRRYECERISKEWAAEALAARGE